MKLSDYDFDLPPEAIAQSPAERRDGSRLLVHRVPTGETTHQTILDLPELLEPGDLLVVNDTRVLPARLRCQRASGGEIELLLIEPELAGRWFAWLRPSRRLSVGERLTVLTPNGSAANAIAEGPERTSVLLVERPTEPDGSVAPHWVVEFEIGTEDLEAFLQRAGSMPLPPYIARGDDDSIRASDRERYQTVYARVPGAVAAPTAGLHLTHELFRQLEARGVERASVTLHVGPGTFQPIQVDDLTKHTMHSERFELPEATAEAIRRTRTRGGRVVAVGTTSARVLEACADGNCVTAQAGATELFLHPGNPPQVVDALLTNFHLPRSSLLVLVASITGREEVLALYQTAIAEGYRFYSYGDAMLLVR